MDKLEALLDKQEKLFRLRKLPFASFKEAGYIYFDDKRYVDFSSNDYLGLSEHPRLKEVAKSAIDKYGVSSSASRLLSGDLKLFHQLEEEIAIFKGKESALIFNSGYQANVGIISCLCDREDVIFLDKLAHASIIDGTILSKANFFRFKHNDIEHLEYLLKKERKKFKRALIITESIFSMDGDKAKLAELVNLKQKYDCLIMVDEAHATGIFGKNGSGVVEEENLIDKIDIIMGTFSKALGSFGAYVACSKTLKQYFINFSRSFIYSTALPPQVIAVNLESIKIIKEEPHRRKILLENACYLREELKKIGFSVLGCSQIVPVVIGDEKSTINLSKRLQDKGFWAPAIRPPTVEEKSCRIRFSLSYNHTKDTLSKLIDAIRG